MGSLLAAALSQKHFNVLLLDKNDYRASDDPQENSRPISLAYGSVELLKQYGVWSALAAYASPILQVHSAKVGVWGEAVFSAEEESVDALGQVVPFDFLKTALFEAAARQVTFKKIDELTHVDTSESGTNIAWCSDGVEQTASAQLLIAADGTQSSLRERLGIEADIEQGRFAAAAGRITLHRPHSYVAYERFSDQGTLAILPLKDRQQAAFVWSMTPDAVATWREQPEPACLTQLSHLMRHRLGQVTGLTKGVNYPLTLLQAKTCVKPGFVLMGNAAHTLYPIAAQGFNLALQDAATLIDVLCKARRAQQPLSSMTVLTPYADKRTRAQARLQRLLSAIDTLYLKDWPGCGIVRGKLLGLVDMLRPLKREVAGITMGLRDVSETIT